MSVRKKYGLAIMVAGFAALLCFFFAPDAYNPFSRTVALKGHTPSVVGQAELVSHANPNDVQTVVIGLALKNEADLEKLIDEQDDPSSPNYQKYLTTDEFKAKILTLASESFRLFDVLGLIGVVVAALGVVNTLMMNVLERQREIGSLRSLGLTRWQTTKMVLAEAATLGVIGGVFGLGFGYVLSQIFITALNAMSGYDLQYLFTLSPFLAGAAIALIVSQVAALYPAWKAAGVNIVEAVKHE